jgi:hypothetical protein
MRAIPAIIVLFVKLALGVPDEYNLGVMFFETLYDGLDCDAPTLQSNPGCKATQSVVQILPILAWIALLVEIGVIILLLKKRQW